MGDQSTVGKSFTAPDKTTLTSGNSHDITIGKSAPGVFMVTLIADVDIHLSETSPASTSNFLIKANTPFDLRVQDIQTFSVHATSNGFLYVLELND